MWRYICLTYAAMYFVFYTYTVYLNLSGTKYAVYLFLTCTSYIVYLFLSSTTYTVCLFLTCTSSNEYLFLTCPHRGRGNPSPPMSRKMEPARRPGNHMTLNPAHSDSAELCITWDVAKNYRTDIFDKICNMNSTLFNLMFKIMCACKSI